MKESTSTKYYWGIGLENETYLKFEESLEVTGDFVKNNIGCERYSIDYRTCYKEGILDKVLRSGFIDNKKYQVSRMINSHSLDKLDLSYRHKTIPGETPPEENPEYDGKSILENFLERQPHNIKSMVTQKTNPMGSICFDGDSIEFVTKYFENRTITESCNELRTTKKLFIDKLNESGVLNGKLDFPTHNIGFNMFMSNQEKLVLFNNGTYHFHLTLPILTENSRIVDYLAFEEMHTNAIYLLQWFEPLFIATLGSPDVMGVISKKHNLKEKFALGSMRNAMSRYTGVGTYNKSMPKGKVLTYPVEDFRKLLKFTKEDNIWWRDRIENTLDYQLLNDVGLDFNLEKMYQSGFEFRSFDEFPASYLSNVLHAIVLICEHSLHLPNVVWGHDTEVWNNLVYTTLLNGFETEISPEEKQALVNLLQLQLSENEEYSFAKITRLDEFYFAILEVLHEKYKDNNTCIDSMFGAKTTSAPTWDNFNEFQIQEHLKQIEGL